MKVVTAQHADDLLTNIKNRFTEFNRLSTPSKSRRYPEDLAELVRHALADGVRPIVLRKLTGVSSNTMERWIKGSRSAAVQRRDKQPLAPRRLEVVSSETGTALRGLITVRLRSGVTIEFNDGASLSSDLLTALLAVEVRDVASR